MECVTPDIGISFQVVEHAMRDIFLPYLFHGATAQINGREIISLPVKKARIALPKPNWTAGEHCTASCVITDHLVTALSGTSEFRSSNPAFLMGKRGDYIRQKHAEDAGTAKGEARAAASKMDTKWLGRIQQTGVWLSVSPSTVNGK